MLTRDTDLDLTPLEADGATIERNQRKTEGDDGRCLLCMAPIRRPERAKAVHLVRGGTHLALAGEPYRDDGSDLCTYLIGPECYRKHRETLKPYTEGNG